MAMPVSATEGTLSRMPVPAPSALSALSEAYAAWWIDFLGEHNHVGGQEATRWLLDRSRLEAGQRMLDCGAFVGAAARMATDRLGVRAAACDVSADFLHAGRQLAHGESVAWAAANTQRLPFRDGSFESVWALDTYIAPREMSRVAAKRATICLCAEAPTDSRGGGDSFVEEWAEYGWTLAAHRQMSSEATQAWRNAEGEMVRRRHEIEHRYGTRNYLAQLDMVANLVYAYERGEQGHGLFVFARG